MSKKNITCYKCDGEFQDGYGKSDCDAEKAEYIKNYEVQLTFNNGEIKSVDLKNMIFQDHRKIFKPLRDLTYFKKFEIKFNTIAWANKLDPEPEYLYKLAKEQESSKTTTNKNTQYAKAKVIKISHLDFNFNLSCN